VLNGEKQMLCLLFAIRYSLLAIRFSFFTFHLQSYASFPYSHHHFINRFQHCIDLLALLVEIFLKKKLYLEKQSNIFQQFGVSLMIPAH
jgi:hypothetical protein